uniref:IlGF domain-containing protein n=1 Tax=Syphacia muris TaxID=451379 RepID=A0A0N5AYU4_9BILA
MLCFQSGLRNVSFFQYSNANFDKQDGQRGGRGRCIAAVDEDCYRCDCYTGTSCYQGKCRKFVARRHILDVIMKH